MRLFRHISVKDINILAFWRHVGKHDKDQCWPWLASKKPNGYGQFTIKRIPFYAHRVAYALIRGRVPRNKVADHLCGNRACVNPWHINIATQGDHLRRHASERTHCGKGLHEYPRFYVKRKHGGRCLLCERIYERGRKSRKRTIERGKRIVEG